MTGAAALPLLAARDLGAPLIHGAGSEGTMSAAQFLAEATALAERLPARGTPINLCHDRGRFAIGFAAALLRGQTSLMPPNALPETLALLRGDGAHVYAIVDAPDVPLDLGALSAVAVGAPTRAAPRWQVPLIDAELEAVRLLTSGSTGTPQPHGKRFGQLVANIGSEADRLARDLRLATLHGVSLLATVPPQHSYGFESSVLLALLGGAVLDAGRPFYPADVAAALERRAEPRALVTTPFHLKTLLRAGVALPRTALILSATAPLSPQLAAQAEGQLGGTLIEIYGCTEAGQVASRRTTEGDIWEALGTLRFSREMHDGAERFLVAGGHVAEPTPLADILELHDARHFRLLGRAQDLIHVAGKRSSLAHLNYQLNRIDGVQDGAFWMPEESADGVTRPVAFVVAPALTAAQITTALRGLLDGAFVPRRIVHLAELPREATGKITAATLARLAQAAQAAPAAPAARALDSSENFVVPPDHPAFAGHFPGAPVLPGVVLIDLAFRALEARLGPIEASRIENVKFLAPVGPGATLRVHCRHDGARVSFEVTRIDREPAVVVARGQISVG